MNRFTVLIVELYTYVKTYQIIYFQCVQFIAFQLHLNKAVKMDNNSLGEQQQKKTIIMIFRQVIISGWAYRYMKAPV